MVRPLLFAAAFFHMGIDFFARIHYNSCNNTRKD